MIIRSTGQCYRIYAIQRTKGTLPGKPVSVKVAKPGNTGLAATSPVSFHHIKQQNFPNLFIYLINCSAFVRIWVLDRAISS
ncbi:MAG TPA: hypothetical protein DD781_03630 [Leclercia adecarboxylata]|nr:hypothetical protein [Leclercia adecarboxylata]